MKITVLCCWLMALSLLASLHPLQAQKRVAITGNERYLNNTTGAHPIEAAIHTVMLGKGWTVVSDTVATDLKIRFSASSVAGNNTGSLVFVYVNAEVSLIEMPAQKETQHLMFQNIKGGGVNMQSANQKAYQAASKKIADSIGQLLQGSRPAASIAAATEPAVKIQPSDVDLNIPSTPVRNDKTYALVIGNEDYKSFQAGLNDEVNVDFAMRDASVFKTYLNKTLGVPEENIKLLLNARSIEMSRELKKLVSYIKTMNGTADVIVFYAGHGLPDEVTKAPYIMPVDVSGTDLQFAIKLTDMYAQLTAYPARRVTVFIDACFTGGARGQALIAARGVKVKPVEDALSGNLVVFSASSGEQSSLAYKEKGHGMFTYFLLKKIQESKGNVTYKNLSDYLTREVSLQSLRVNNKEQNPGVTVSEGLDRQWESWTLKP